MSGRFLGLWLADGLKHFSEPRLANVEGLVAFDSWEVDDAHDASVVFVKTGDTTDALKGSLRSDDGALSNEFALARVEF